MPMRPNRPIRPKPVRKVQQRISILVPFQSDDPGRNKTWRWLERYWRHELPGAELIVGRDRRAQKNWTRKPVPFSKAVAVNDAFRRSHGDIIVILDADAYLPGEVIEQCARRLRLARKKKIQTWFVPYMFLYRLKQGYSNEILRSGPANPLRVPTPPPPKAIDGTDASGAGREFGALLQVMPREAFEKVGGMDERFRGWGGEDTSFLLALDTLWGKHKNTANEICHLWHRRLASGPLGSLAVKNWMVRMWPGQKDPRANGRLSSRYHQAHGRPEVMAKLVRERR